MNDTNKEIARDILLKLIEAKALFFQTAHANLSPEEITNVAARNVKTVCDAYKQIFKAVASSNA